MQVMGEDVGFDSDDAAESPGECYDAFDEKGFERISGCELLTELVAECLEFVLIFIRERGFAGEQAVLCGVAGNDGFALSGARAGALAGVFSVSNDSFS